MNQDKSLKQIAEERGISFGPGRIDQVDFDENGCADWSYGAEAIKNLDGEQLTEAGVRLGLDAKTPPEEIREQLLELMNDFKFFFHEYVRSFDDQDSDPLVWIGDGESFHDGWHHAAWILARAGVLQASRLEVQGFGLKA